MSVAAALRDKNFRKKYFEKLNNPDYIYANADDYPDMDVSILDLQTEPEGFDIEAKIREMKPDVVGVSAISATVDSASELSKIAKRAAPDCLTVIGGVHVSQLSEETMKNSEFQVGVLGEGEETFMELTMALALGKKDFSGIKGLAEKNNDGSVSVTPASKGLMKADEFPMASRTMDLLNVAGYAEVINFNGENLGVPGVILTSRGCTNDCAFCAARCLTSCGP